MQEVERENGKVKLHEVYGTPVYKEKDRSNHAHHCQDAVVIACMNKSLYDTLAASWRSEEKGDHKKARKILERCKPWKTFTQDVKAIPEEILVVHHAPDNVGKKAKRKMRKRGVIQRNKKGEPIYLKGDAARGSLHKEFFYGAILRPEKDKKTDTIKLDKNGKPIEKLYYVRREELAGLKDDDLKYIVDERVKKIAIEGRKKEKKIREEIKMLKEKIENEIYVLPNKNGSPVPIKKVRLKRPTVTDPIHLKLHRDASIHEYKQEYHVMNDGNYMISIYEGEDKKR